MTSVGPTAMDLGNANAIGGMAHEFIQNASRAKFDPNNGSPELGFRPSQAEELFRALLKQADVPVFYEHRLKTRREGRCPHHHARL